MSIYDMKQKLLENEVILLKNIYDHIDEMLNLSIVEIQGSDPHCNVMFHDSNGKKLFYILLHDFLSKTEKRGPIDHTSFLDGLLKISQNPQFSLKNSEIGLMTCVQAFIAWVEEKKDIHVWMPSISKNITLSISRMEAIKMCSNLSKHNDLRAIRVVEQLKEIMKASGIVIVNEQAMVALQDFYERFQNDILIYLSSYICEFLNNIRWSIRDYLLPEFNRSYYSNNDNDIPGYSYKIPEQIKCDYAKYCYWELMNILRRKPFMRKFIISSSFKCEY